MLKVGELRNYLQNTHLDNQATFVPIIVICFGVFIFVLSFFGCSGALQENCFLLETYSIFLLVLVVMQIVLSSLIFLFIDDINRDSIRSFTKLWRLRSMPDKQIIIDMLQENLECCGSNGIFDYNFEKLPLSCCRKDAEFCLKENAFSMGCKQHLFESIQSSGYTLSYLCILTAVFEVGMAYSIFKFKLFQN